MNLDRAHCFSIETTFLLHTGVSSAVQNNLQKMSALLLAPHAIKRPICTQGWVSALISWFDLGSEGFDLISMKN